MTGQQQDVHWSRPMLRGAVALAMAAVLALAATACGDDDDSSSSSGGGASSETAASASKEPFKVLAVLPMSGPLAAVGKSEEVGFKAATKVINDEGGILGHPVEVKVVDSGGAGPKAVSLAIEESRKEDYNQISCGSFGDDALPCADAIAKTPSLQIPLAAESRLNDPKAKPYTFMPGNLFDPAEQALAEHMKAKGVQKVAIVVGDNTTGRLASEILKKACEAAGLTVTGSTFVPVTAKDATPQLQKAQASNPDAIAITGFTPANGPILAARTKLGWDVPVYGDVYFAAFNLALIAKPAQMKGITLEAYPWMVKGNAATETPEFKAFWSNVLALEPHPVLSDIANLVSYSPLMLARAAAEKAKSVDGPKMAEAMGGVAEGAQVKGFIGPKLLYTPTQHVYRATPDDFTFVPAGPTVDGILVPGDGAGA